MELFIFARFHAREGQETLEEADGVRQLGMGISWTGNQQGPRPGATVHPAVKPG
jgi:hypothetical protein